MDPSTQPAPDVEIVSTRVLLAARHVVFRAFTDPAKLARWWGPNGFTNTFHTFDPRTGGEWRFVMHGPDGADYQMRQEFVEVVAPERIVLQHHHPTHGFRMTMEFSEEQEGTRILWCMRFESADEAARVRGLVTAANEENFDRLAALLAEDV